MMSLPARMSLLEPSVASPPTRILSDESAIQVQSLSHQFGGRAVLDGIDLNVPEGSVLALLGPSGCGKSTLLKILAGLLRPDAGVVVMSGTSVAGPGVFVPPERRQLGMVFQDYALWPHMTVAGNVAFPLKMRGVDRIQQAERVQEALSMVGLDALGERRPGELSGGQQQRVALARAVVASPRVLLFDEPLSNLDRDLRESLCVDMARLLRQIGATAVYVTHDHAEAYALADQVARMAQGRIQSLESLPPKEV